MKNFIVLLSGLMVALVALPILAHSPPEMEKSEAFESSGRSLSSLVKAYVEEDSPERANELLADIQHMPEANVESISIILQQPTPV